MRLYGVLQEPVALRKRGPAAPVQPEHRTRLLEEEEAQGRVYMLCAGDDLLLPVQVEVAAHTLECYPPQRDSVRACP